VRENPVSRTIIGYFTTVLNISTFPDVHRDCYIIATSVSRSVRRGVLQTPYHQSYIGWV
jgi:hypothetical protein